MENNQDNNELYSDLKGTGPLSAIIFTIISLIIMFIVSKIIA